MRGRHRADRKTDYVQKNQRRGRSNVDLLRFRFTHFCQWESHPLVKTFMLGNSRTKRDSISCIFFFVAFFLFG